MDMPDNLSPLLVYITVPDKVLADRMAHRLVEERLAACVNLLPISSVYRWEGKVCQGQEIAVVAKTTRTQWEALRERVIALHPYACPAIVALSVTGGHEPFLRWIQEETGKR